MRFSVSIIIPSLNSPIIDQVIASVLSQAGQEMVCEIWVIGRDEAGLLAQIQSDKVRFVDTGQPILSAKARNQGISLASGELLLFLDSDCLAEAGWLMAHLAAHEAGHRVVSGSVLPWGQNYWHLVYNLTLFHEFLSLNSAGIRDFLATLNLSLDRTVIDEIGGMLEVNRGGDVEWTTRMRRAGIQPYFIPNAPVRHLHNRTNWQRTWLDCAKSGHHMRQIRLHHAGFLQAPFLLRFPLLLLLFSPIIAAWATTRILYKRPYLFTKFGRSIPGIYLTKIAWCWGASRPTEPQTFLGRS